MANSTITSLILNVKSNLGNRYTGKIGPQSVEDVALAKMNNIILDIAREFWYIPELERQATVAVTSSTNTYALPTTDVDSNDITISAIVKAIALKSGETRGYLLRRVSEAKRGEIYPTTSAALATGRICAYTQFGGRIDFFPFPDGSYTVTLHCATLPTAVTLANNSPYSRVWDDVIEAGATAWIFQALQLADDAGMWRSTYSRLIERNRRLFLRKPDWKPGFTGDSGIPSTDPVNDPFVKEWNS